MLTGVAISLFGLADLVCFIKNMRKFRELSNLVNSLCTSRYMDVSQVVQKLRDLPIGSKMAVIVKGIIKAKQKSGDKNIFSLIMSTSINKSDKLKEYLYERVPFRKIMKNAFWSRPESLKKVSFSLKDLQSAQKMRIDLTKNSQISGILSEMVTFETKLAKSPNKLLNFFKSILSSTMIFNPVYKIGQKISYYGIMDNNFGYVVGEATKKADGETVIEGPRFVTKQIAFILFRLKNQLRIYKIMLFLYLLSNLFLVYCLVKWLHKNYAHKFTLFSQEEEEIEADIPFHQLCIVCYCSPRSIIFKPCKHYGVCYGCFKKMNSCPICKQKIEGVIRVVLK